MKATPKALRAITLWAFALAIISQLALHGETILEKERFARAMNGLLPSAAGLTAIALMPLLAVEIWLSLRRRVVFATEGLRRLQLGALITSLALLIFSFTSLPYFESDPRAAHERLKLAGATLAQAALGLLFFSALSLSFFQSIEASAYPGAAKVRAALALLASALIFILSAKAIIALISGGPLFPS